MRTELGVGYYYAVMGAAAARAVAFVIASIVTKPFRRWGDPQADLLRG